MRLTRLPPGPRLDRWIHQMWVFESPTGLPAGDMRIVVPNGRAKLIVPWRNGLTAEDAGRRSETAEGTPVLIGLWDAPTVISSSLAPTVSIGIEFHPLGLSRFLDVPMSHLNGGILPIGDVIGREGDRLARHVASAETIGDAVAMVRSFLVARIDATERPDPGPVGAALRLMAQSGYTIDVGTMERRLGVSRRHLSSLFQRDVGFAPKLMNSVLAFETLYRAFSHHRSATRLRQDALGIFYDQSHFIRHFKRFAGTTPTGFAEMDNEFGRLFYL